MAVKKEATLAVEREPAVRLRDGFMGGREEMAEKVSSCFSHVCSVRVLLGSR